MPETVIVTGAAGFIGSHLCEALLRRGDAVVALDAFTAHYDPARKRANLAAVERTADALGARGRWRFVEGDARDRATLDGLFEAGARAARAAQTARAAGGADGPAAPPGPGAGGAHGESGAGGAGGARGGGGALRVVHLAARAGVRGALDEAADYVSANLVATTEVLEACRRHGLGGGRGHLVLASSSTVYGSGPPGWDGPFSEDLAADRPLSVYGATKRGCELLAHAYERLAALRVTCLRFFGVVGPRVRTDLSAYAFTDAVARGRPITKFGDGTTARDYTYVGDVVAGILLALDRFERAAAGLVAPGGDFECVNLGNDRPVTLNEYLDALGRLLDRPVLTVPAPEHPMDARRTWADLAKARRLLGYRPSTPFEEALRHVVDWYQHEISPLGSGTAAAAAAPHSTIARGS